MNDERRDAHRELKNRNRNPKQFHTGDLVIVVKKQIQTNAEKGPAKSRISARGHRVIREPLPGAYHVRKLPATAGARRRGRIVKESAARLEHLPSTLTVNKVIDGIDTRLASFNYARVDNPLESALGLHEFGRYCKAPKTTNFSFTKVEDMWEQIAVSDSEDDEIDDSDEGNREDDDDNSNDGNGEDEEKQKESGTNDEENALTGNKSDKEPEENTNDLTTNDRDFRHQQEKTTLEREKTDRKKE